MGCRSEIYSSLLASVSEETEVPEDLIASASRRAEHVDARYILVKLLSMQGFTPSATASLIGHKQRAITRILEMFEDRLRVSPLMKVNYERIKQALK